MASERGTALGFIEITGVVAAVDALDIMCKAAQVKLATWERKLGGRLVTIVVEGDVAAVKQAVDAACTQAIKKPAASGVIAAPHDEIRRIIAVSASRFMKQTNAGGEETVTAPADGGHRMLGNDPPDFNLKEQLKQGE